MVVGAFLPKTSGLRWWYCHRCGRGTGCVGVIVVMVVGVRGGRAPCVNVVVIKVVGVVGPRSGGLRRWRGRRYRRQAGCVGVFVVLVVGVRDRVAAAAAAAAAAHAAAATSSRKVPGCAHTKSAPHRIAWFRRIGDTEANSHRIRGRGGAHKPSGSKLGSGTSLSSAMAAASLASALVASTSWPASRTLKPAPFSFDLLG
mmetsp:Transcript_75630/g.216546  ORF Transcript_75630/g.216546 Transcript_75630/m.216546 type:complete len:200 (+) Transcript_75630:109-708(+)